MKKREDYDVGQGSGWVKKCFLKMKLLVFSVVFLGLTTVSAETYSQEVFSLRVKNKTLAEVFKEISRVTDYEFMYSGTELQHVGAVSIDAREQDLDAVMAACLEGTGLWYKVEDNIVIVSPKYSQPIVPQRAVTLRGTVKDAKGMTLPGVAVMLKGTTVGVTTDIDGNYALTVPEQPEFTLVFSFMGMKTVERVVKDEQPLVVVLEEDTKMIDEVVVTGYQTIKSGRATGSFQILKQENMDNIVAVDIKEKLEGTVPGLMVNTDGSMLIRGQGTFQASTEPLIVVDGFPMESSTLNLNPADIEQVTVLKDAASAAIYGVRGANGVVVITTKRGSEGKLQVNASASVQVGAKPDISDLEFMSVADHVDLEWELCNTGILVQPMSYGQIYSEVGDVYLQYNAGTLTEAQAMEQLQALKEYDNEEDLEEYFYQPSILQQYNISMRGGSDRWNFYAAAGFNKERQDVIGNENWRMNFMVNNDIKFGKAVTLQIGLKGNYYKQENNGMDVISTGIRPYIKMLDEEGNYVNEYYGTQQSVKDDLVSKGYLDWSYNRLQERRMNDNTTKGNNLSANVNLTVDLFDGLNLTTGFVYETGTDKGEIYYPVESYYARNMINRFTFYDVGSGAMTNYIPKGGVLNTNNSWLYNWTWRGSAAYNKTIKDFSFSVSAGLEFSCFHTQNAIDWYYGYDPQTLVTFAIDQSTLQSGIIGYDNKFVSLYDAPSRSDVEDRYASFFAIGNVTYKEKYDLFGSYRLDKTNLFGRSSQYRDNPAYSIGGKWTISSEPFFDADWISRLAFKLSYGVSGNIDKSTSPYMIGSELADFQTSEPALLFGSPENPQLSWEKSFVWNVGAEFSMLDDRLSGTVEWYRKASKDILAPEQLDYTTGWTSAMKNSASILNRGVDINLNGVIVDRALRYDMGLILSYNYNKVTSIRRSVTSITDLLSTTPLEGKPVDYVYAWRNAGLDENGEPMVYNRAGEKFSWMNMSDLTLDDVDFVGRSTPPVFGSWNNKLSWNGFTLDFMFTYKFGHKIRKPYTARTFNSRDEMVHKSLADRWQQPGDEMHTWIPRVSDSAYESSQRMMATICSDKLLDDGAIIRLRSLNLGYNFATLLKNNTFVKDLNLKFTAENLFYWSKSGYDTDHILNTYSETNLDFPEARRYTFSLSLSF